MFARFSGFGPGHKSTYHVTKVFRDEIREVFGIVGHGKDLDDTMGESFEGIDHDKDLGQEDEGDYDNESDGDSDNSEENREDLGDHQDDLLFEDELGYAPL